MGTQPLHRDDNETNKIQYLRLTPLSNLECWERLFRCGFRRQTKALSGENIKTLPNSLSSRGSCRYSTTRVVCRTLADQNWPGVTTGEIWRFQTCGASQEGRLRLSFSSPRTKHPAAIADRGVFAGIFAFAESVNKAVLKISTFFQD